MYMYIPTIVNADSEKWQCSAQYALTLLIGSQIVEFRTKMPSYIYSAQVQFCVLFLEIYALMLKYHQM